MWRWFFKPEVLFFLGAAQSLSPFILWALQEPFPNYYYVISHIPAVIWISGYAAFWVGAKCAGLRKYPPPNRRLARNMSLHRPLTIVVLVAVLVQIAALSGVYGGVPILQFLSGRSHAAQAEELTFTHAFPGQLGLFLNSQLVLAALIVILLVSAASEGRRHRLLLLVSIVAALAAGLSTGKRQTVAILIVMMGCSCALYFGNTIRPALRYFGLRRSKWLARVLLVTLPIAFVAFLGYVVRVRTGFHVTGGQQVLATWHIGLINLQTQAAAVGYGPKQYDILQLTQYMLPDRVFRRMALAKDRAPRAEPTASAGFYGDLHWNTGLPGVIIFSFFTGWLAKYFYFRARSSLYHLLTYSLMCWTLIAAHSYNHFLHLNFLLLPSVLYWVLAWILGRPAARIRTGAQARRTAAVSPRYEPFRSR